MKKTTILLFMVTLRTLYISVLVNVIHPRTLHITVSVCASGSGLKCRVGHPRQLPPTSPRCGEEAGVFRPVLSDPSPSDDSLSLFNHSIQSTYLLILSSPSLRTELYQLFVQCGTTQHNGYCGVAPDRPALPGFHDVAKTLVRHIVTAS